MVNLIDKDAGIVNCGNNYRLKNVFKRAINGDNLTIAFIGGSITQGCLSSVHETCYAYLTYKWWETTFPNANLKYLNAGIGGTTSHLGVGRVEEDVLSYEPDFVIVEFSVNDESNTFFEETYEGLIRKVYSSKKKPAVLIVNNVYYHNGGNAELFHNRIGRHYDIPCVSMQSSIFPQVVKGIIDNRDITPDDLHPNDNGHALVAAVITNFLNKVLIDINNDESEAEYKEPVTLNRYETAVRYRNKDIDAVTSDFEKDLSKQENITDCFKYGWSSTKPCSKLVFEIEGSEIAVQYRKSMSGKSCTAKVIIDDDENNAVNLDGNFDEDWGDKLELTVIAENLPKTKHKVTIITEDKEAKVPFYVVSVIAAK